MYRPEKFWNRVALRYASQPVSDETAYQQKLQITQSYFKPEMRVLEIGCGTGSTAIAHAPYVNHIHATDISPAMLEIAQAKAEQEHIKNIRFECMGVDELAIPEQSLDAVLGMSILHLLENKEETITKVFKMLKPGGVFVTSTACIGDSMRFFKAVAPIGRFLGLMPLVKVFSSTELVESLTDAGFVIDHYWKPDKGMAVFIVAKKLK